MDKPIENYSKFLRSEQVIINSINKQEKCAACNAKIILFRKNSEMRTGKTSGNMYKIILFNGQKSFTSTTQSSPPP